MHKHRVISFYCEDLPKHLVELQKKVFDHFGIDVEQIEFPLLYASGPLKGSVDHDRHANAIQNFLNNNTDWDSVSIFDVDAVPFQKDCIERAKEIIKDNNTIYGNIQVSNTCDTGSLLHLPLSAFSLPFIGPSFINFTKKVWEESNHKSFVFAHYPNPEGKIIEADVAEIFCRENEKQGRRLVYAYPTHCYVDKTWKWSSKFGFPQIDIGNATEFESGVFHNFQIRIPDKQRYFVNYCNNIINNAKRPYINVS